MHGLAGPGFAGKIREEDGRFDSELIDQQMQYLFFGGRLAVFFVILRPQLGVNALRIADLLQQTTVLRLDYLHRPRTPDRLRAGGSRQLLLQLPLIIPAEMLPLDMLHEYLILMLDFFIPSLIIKQLCLELTLLVIGDRWGRCQGRYELLLPGVDMLDGHQPLPMLLVIALDLHDLHEALLILHPNNNTIKVNIKSEPLLAQHPPTRLEHPRVVDVRTPSFFLLLHEGPDMEEEMLALGLLLGLVDLVLLALELVDVVVIFVDLVQFTRDLDVLPEIQEVGIDTTVLLLFRVVEVFLGLVCTRILFCLLAAIEVGPVFGILLPGDQSLIEHFLELEEDEVFLFGDVAFTGDHTHPMEQLADQGLFLDGLCEVLLVGEAFLAVGCGQLLLRRYFYRQFRGASLRSCQVILIGLLTVMAAEKRSSLLFLSKANIRLRIICLLIVPSQIQQLLLTDGFLIIQPVYFEQLIPILAGIVDLPQFAMQILHFSLGLQASQVLAASDVGKRVYALETLQGFYAFEGTALFTLEVLPGYLFFAFQGV